MSTYKSKRLKKKHRLSFDTKRFEIDFQYYIICTGTYINCTNNNIKPNKRRIKSYARWLHHNTSDEEWFQYIKKYSKLCQPSSLSAKYLLIGTSISKTM